MRAHPWIVSALAISTLLAAAPCLAAAAGDAAITPEEADADFALQGEYVGDAEKEGKKQRWGAQVIALGKGKFRAAGYPGGLPGDGWNEKEKMQAEGAREGDVAKFKVSDGDQLSIKDGVMTVTNSGGEKIATLKKVHRQSETLGAKPPTGAVVLFDGSDTKNFPGAKMTDDGLLIQGATSKPTFGSGRLHVEFLLPYMPEARGQGRGNSGCYLQGRYEVQMLDSFGLEGKNNECGGIYGVSDPRINMCYPPLSWQTYDIDFTAAQYEGGKKVKNARMTVRHNGVVVQDDVEVPDATRAAPVKESPDPGPLYLQNHGNPVRYRNIWVVEKR